MSSNVDRRTYDQLRSRRQRAVRARTISIKRLPRYQLVQGRALNPEQPGIDYQRPRRRADCQGGPRPCPFVSCSHHLYLDVLLDTGAIKLNFPDLEPHELHETCSLDVADRGGATLEEVGALMNITRERTRQIEVRALAEAEAVARALALDEGREEGPIGRRRLPLIDDGDDENLTLYSNEEDL